MILSTSLVLSFISIWTSADVERSWTHKICLTLLHTPMLKWLRRVRATSLSRSDVNRTCTRRSVSRRKLKSPNRKNGSGLKSSDTLLIKRHPAAQCYCMLKIHKILHFQNPDRLNEVLYYRCCRCCNVHSDGLTCWWRNGEPAVDMWSTPRDWSCRLRRLKRREKGARSPSPCPYTHTHRNNKCRHECINFNITM